MPVWANNQNDAAFSWLLAVQCISPRRLSVPRQLTGSLEATMTNGHGMRPVVLQMGVTFDGFVHGAKGYEDWRLPPEDDAVVAWKVASLRDAGTHIMGRATYEAMASVRPNTTGVYADVMNEIPKVVFSKTLSRADWAEGRIASGDLADDIDRLKREPGGAILAHGGATFVDALIRDGLIDEYRLVIHPVAIGHGPASSARFASRYGWT
jgi:dihydrofolate reductase